MELWYESRWLAEITPSNGVSVLYFDLDFSWSQEQIVRLRSLRRSCNGHGQDALNGID